MTTLEASTQTYLKSRNVSLTTTALDQARDAALTSLKAALRTGDPVDAQAVAFLMDYFNDSDADIATLRSALYGSDALMDNYVNVLKRPMTDALAPLMMSAQFAPGVAQRDATVLAALKNGRTLGLQPPVQTLAFLATLPSFTNPAAASPPTVTGKQAAAYFAEEFIRQAAASGQAVPLDLLNTYIAFSPSAATAFLDGILRNNLRTAHGGLLDAYRQLNPIGATSPPGGATTNPGDLNVGFDPNPPAIKGWSWFAMQLVIDAGINGRPVDAALLRQLNATNPIAAAYGSWVVLANQLANDEPFDGQCLEILSAVKPDVARVFVEQRLQKSFGVPNVLLRSDGAGGYTGDYDGITGDATPTIRAQLDAMGREPKVGDKIGLWIDGNFHSEETLTADDIQRGYKDITSDDLSAFQGAHQAVTRIKDGVTGELSEASPRLVFTLNYSPPTVNTSSSSFEETGLWVDASYAVHSTYSTWINFDSQFELASVPPLTVTAYNSDGVVLPTQGPTNVIVDSQNKRIFLKFDLVVQNQGGPVKVRISSDTGIVDVEGGSTNIPFTAEIRRGLPQTAVTAQAPTPVPPAPPPPPQRMLDHNALNALQALDPAAAATWRNLYTSAGLLGTKPPAPPPAPGTAPALTAEELLNLDLETLVYRIFMGRFDAIDDLLKQQLSSVQKINEDMAKLSDLLGEVNGLVELIPADTAPSKKISEISPAVADTAAGDRINTALALIPGLVLFDETKATGGKYDRTKITKGGLLAVQQNLKAKLDSMSNMQQHETLRTQMMNSKRLECLTAISNLLEAANNCKKDILRNIA